MFTPPVSIMITHQTTGKPLVAPTAIPAPPRNCGAEEETEEMLLIRLWGICDRYRLELQQRGRFFVVADNAKQRLLKGFVLPQSTEWCWFYRPAVPEETAAPTTVCFADEGSAETFVKGFFTIE